jgi:hypothetical protein
MRAFTDPIARRHLQQLMAVSGLRDPRIEQLLADVADRIGGQSAILSVLEDLAARNRGRRVIREMPR